MKHMISALFLCVIILLTTSCGDSSGGSSEGNSTIKTGIFVDAPVVGLYFETSSLSGKTDSKGSFLYREGEEITFKIGNLALGNAKATALMTPLSLTGENDIYNISTKSTDIANA